MQKIMLIINPTSGGEKALDYKEKLESKAKKYFEQVDTRITQKAQKLLGRIMMQSLFLVEMGLSMK